VSQFVSVSFSTSSQGGQTKIRDGVKLHVQHGGQTKTCDDGVKLHVSNTKEKKEVDVGCPTGLADI
jgi:hypothetical protein